jgi:hypothetical protein
MDTGDRRAQLADAENEISRLNDLILRDWRAPADKRVRLACEVVRLVAGFVGEYLDSDLAAIYAELRRDKDFVEAFGKIHHGVVEFRGYLVAIGQTGSNAALVAELTQLAAELRQRLEEAVRVFVAVVNEQSAQDQRAAVARAKALASEVMSQLRASQHIHMADQTLGAAADAATQHLGSDYETYADRETRVADKLRWAVAGLIAAVSGCAVSFLIWAGDVTLQNELVRLSVTIPLAVLAGYLAKESAKHRAAARKARDLAIAMRTVRGYAEPLDDIGRELQRALGLRAFGAGAEQPTETEKED